MDRRPPRKRALQAPARPAPARADSKQIVDAVLDAVVMLPIGAPLKAIADRAGVGVASLHRYFPTRAAIYAELSRRMQRDFVTFLRATLAAPATSATNILEALCRFAVSVPRPLRAVLNLDVPFAWTEDNATAWFSTAVDEITGWLAARMPAPPPDLRHRVFAAFAVVRGITIYSTMMPDASLDDDALVRLMLPSVRAQIDLDAVQSG